MVARTDVTSSLIQTHFLSLSVLLSLTFLLGCESQPAADSPPILIGMVTDSTGYPEVIRKNQTYMLAAQSRIYVDDVVVTDKDSKALLTMQDGSTFAIGPLTHFVFHRFNVAKDQTLRQANMTLSSGSVEGKVASSRKARIEIRTPLGRLFARSSNFWTGLAFSDNRLDAALWNGYELMIKNSHGARIIAEKNSGTAIIGDSAPRPVKLWSRQQIDQAIRQTNL